VAFLCLSLQVGVFSEAFVNWYFTQKQKKENKKKENQLKSLKIDFF